MSEHVFQARRPAGKPARVQNVPAKAASVTGGEVPESAASVEALHAALRLPRVE
jgi:hypothetical protein